MAKKISLKKSVLDTIKKFVNLLNQHHIPITQVILFGSYAKGYAHYDSDIDLAVISKQFGHDNCNELIMLRKLALKIDARIEPIPFSPGDLNDPYSTLSQEINKSGIVLK